MRDWFESLDPRERVIVGAGIAVAVAMVYFLAVWEPLTRSNAALQASIAEARELYSYVRRARLEAERQGPVQRAVPSSGRSLLALVDDTAKRSGLQSAVKRIQPEGDATVRVWLEGAQFDQVIRWLDSLQKQHAIAPTATTVDRDGQPGIIKARIALERTP